MGGKKRKFTSAILSFHTFLYINLYMYINKCEECNGIWSNCLEWETGLKIKKGCGKVFPLKEK